MAAAGYMPLAGLLRQIARDVVSTQRLLDASFVSARAAGATSALQPSPTWHRLDNVSIALELATTVRTGAARGTAAALPELDCRVPSPVSIALYGRDAAATTRISVEIAPIAASVEPR